jgi:hypothetical protein
MFVTGAFPKQFLQLPSNGKGSDSALYTRLARASCRVEKRFDLHVRLFSGSHASSTKATTRHYVLNCFPAVQQQMWRERTNRIGK